MRQLRTLGVSLYLVLIIACDKQALPTVYRIEDTLLVDGRTRTYLLNLPPTYYERDNFALIIALHGFAGSALQCERDYHLTEKATESNFVIVYPEGVQSEGPLGLRTWNAGNCCDYAVIHQVDDVKFMTILIEHLVQKFKIDPRKVFITGMSNGAMMAYRLACEIPDRITAIAPVSGTLLTSSPCQASEAVSILHIHSILDEIIPYEGGVGLGGYYFPPVDSALKVWTILNHCHGNGSPDVNADYETYSYTKWANCDEGVIVERYLTRDGGHSWPGGEISRSGADKPSEAFNATDLILQFFKQLVYN